jgi:hypothetical protein
MQKYNYTLVKRSPPPKPTRFMVPVRRSLLWKEKTHTVARIRTLDL